MWNPPGIDAAMLRTLLEDHFIEQEAETRLYRLGPGILELAQGFLRQHGIGGIAMPHLNRLRELTGETVGLQILDGHETVCIATLESRHPVRVAYYVRERMPIYCRSSGFVFLACKSPLSGKLQKIHAEDHRRSREDRGYRGSPPRCGLHG